MTDLTIANTILDQLGNRRFIAMTGARDFVGDASSLTFCIGRGAMNKANAVRITLTPADDYTVEFFAFSSRTLNTRDCGKVSGVYAENLREVFTARTGFATSL